MGTGNVGTDGTFPHSLAPLTGQLAQEFSLIHPVFEGFAAVDEDDRHFVGELTAQGFVAIDVHFLPVKTAAALEFVQGFFDYFAQMASLAGVNHNLALSHHGRSVARMMHTFQKFWRSERSFGANTPPRLKLPDMGRAPAGKYNPTHA